MEDRVDIKHPLLIKNGDLFLVAEQDGNVPKAPPAFGLFFRDCCYLSQYEFSLNGTGPLHLMSAWVEGFAADIELTNANLKASNETPIQTHTLGIKRKQLLIGNECAFIDVIAFRNFSREDVELPFALTFAAGFESIFVLRGAPPGKRGTMHAPEWKNSHVRFSYLGADKILRSLDVSFSMAPIVAPRTPAKTVANFDIVLAPRQRKDLFVSFHINENSKRESRRCPVSCAANAPEAPRLSMVYIEGMARRVHEGPQQRRRVERRSPSLAERHPSSAAQSRWPGIHGRRVAMVRRYLRSRQSHTVFAVSCLRPGDGRAYRLSSRGKAGAQDRRKAARGARQDPP